MWHSIEPANSAARGFLAFPGMTAQLRDELTARFEFSEADFARAAAYGDLLFFPQAPDAAPKGAPWWAMTALVRPFFLSFDSTAAAARALAERQRNWAPYLFQLFRRGSLVQERLPYISLKPRVFPCTIPASPVGLYTLVSENRLLASAETSSPLPAGKIAFAEDRKTPPSRAYLKLWESLALLHSAGAPLPAAGNRCLDAGAAPGGWTWALLKLGAEVLAVDRAELDPRLKRHPRVAFHAHDAFTVPPEDVGPFDWVCSDVVCYPARLLDWIHRWVSSKLCRYMVCTIKMQGAADWKLLAEFAAIEGAVVRHLNYNKHELTWLYARPV
jgi:23S rRNA (cytidine2498-2'-O)-methyltransferase